MRSPAFQFYVRDWLCSKTVNRLHAAALPDCYQTPTNPPTATPNLRSRGVSAYIFLLCNAWLETPTATLPNDDDELAAMARVTRAEWDAIRPLLSTVFQLDTTTGRLFNDRQMEEFLKQNRRAEANSNNIRKRYQTSTKPSSKKLRPEEEDEIAKEDEDLLTPRKGSKARGTESEIVAYCLERELTETDGRSLFSKWEGNGWTNGGHPIKDWKATIRSWQLQGDIIASHKAAIQTKPKIHRVDGQLTLPENRTPAPKSI